MTITEFAESRGKKVQTIYKFIYRHSDELKGHTRKKGTGVELDDYAVNLLDRAYPTPKPLQIIEGIPEAEHLRIIGEKDRQIQELQSRVIELQGREAERLNLICDLTARISVSEAKTDQRVVELTNEVERLKNRSLLDRILNR